MRQSEYNNIFSHESTHFFYQANIRYYLRLIQSYLKPFSRKSILEAGCGTGYLGLLLSDKYTVTGIDANEIAVELARKRGLRVQLGSVNDLPYNNETYDTVACIDVLYHKKVIPGRALAEFMRVLKPGGYLILRVAAHEWLKTSHDIEVQTKKRFEKGEVHKLLKDGGFLIRRITYMNFALLIPLLIRKMLDSKSSASHIKPLNPIINKCATWLLYVENVMGEWLPIPNGIGILAIAQKPSSKKKGMKKK